MSLSTYPEVKEWLYSLKNRGSRYGIERMLQLAAALGNLERRLKFIHIAGTNGKGSTAAMLEAIYRDAGYKTGLFTSPHLVHQGERIQVNRRKLTHEQLVTYTQELIPIAEAIAREDPDLHPSFFEFMTAMALLHFEREQVDIVLWETGLGGRLDSTNIVDPLLCIITSISLEHTDILGHTLAEIAGEKAGIIKKGKPVILGKLPLEALGVIQKNAQEHNAPIYRVEARFGANTADYPQTNLAGSFQRANAAMALLACERLQPTLPCALDNAAKALLNIDWQGRWDVRTLSDRRTLVLDAAHNPEGISMLTENVHQHFVSKGIRPIYIASALGTPRAQALIPFLCKTGSAIYLVRPKQERACTFDELESCAPLDNNIPLIRADITTLFPKTGTCAIGSETDVIVVTGSLYLIGEVLEALTLQAPVAEHCLQD
jgi:dihydrofolate synthase/folylpolyglutamate synthase